MFEQKEAFEPQIQFKKNFQGTRLHGGGDCLPHFTPKALVSGIVYGRRVQTQSSRAMIQVFNPTECILNLVGQKTRLLITGFWPSGTGFGHTWFTPRGV